MRKHKYEEEKEEKRTKENCFEMTCTHKLTLYKHVTPYPVTMVMTQLQATHIARQLEGLSQPVKTSGTASFPRGTNIDEL